MLKVNGTLKNCNGKQPIILIYNEIKTTLLLKMFDEQLLVCILID